MSDPKTPVKDDDEPGNQHHGKGLADAFRDLEEEAGDKEKRDD